MNIKRLFLARAVMTLLLAVAGFTTASAAASWVGNSAIYVNGTWYYGGDDHHSWCTGGAFNGANLGIFGSTIPLGGQSQIHDGGNAVWADGSTMIMRYKIDDGAENDVTLTKYDFSGNNNIFQSGGSTFTTIDITGLSNGDHTITVWFGHENDNVWDKNGSNNYRAYFTVDSRHPNIGTIQWNTTDGGFYEIDAESDLHDLAVYVNGTGTYYTGAAANGAHNCQVLTFKQTANITMTKEHTAIGKDSNHPFKGNFNGNDLTISGLTINKPGDNYQGLFGYHDYQYSIIQKVNIVNCNIEGNYAGGIVGFNEQAKIDHCTVTGTIKGSSILGGIAGYNNGEIKNCFSAATVEGPSFVGSITGRSNGTLTDNFHLATNTGGVGTYNVTTGTDRDGAELAVKITAGDRVTLTLPSTPSYTWNNENLYKNGTVVTLDYAVPTGKYFGRYSVDHGEISNPASMTGEHTLTGFTQDVTISGSYVDSQISLDDGYGAIADIDPLTFNGQAQHPLPVVTYNGEPLEKDVNYTVSYSAGCTNVNEEDTHYTITVTGVGRYTGTLTKNFTIVPFDISADGAIKVVGIDAIYGRTGSTQHPAPVAVTCAAANNATLVEGTDYTLSYSDGCTAPGNYSVNLTGKGNYTGMKTISFTISNGFGITVHNGAATSQYVPIIGSQCDNFQKIEFVMPATELAAMSGKVITSMQFYLCQKALSVWKGTFQVFMKEVSATTLSSFSGTDGATIVYQGSLDGTQNLMTVNFTTPYAYNGGNLLIGIYETKNDNFSNAYFYGETVNGASIWGYNQTSLASVTTASLHNFLPKTTFWYETPVTLADNAMDNSETISGKNGETVSVTLDGRELYKDGDWNTICLPFDVTLADSPLAGATAKTLETASLENGTLTLNFGDDETTLTAGTPYIIRWGNPACLVIKTTAEWETFAADVSNGTESYEGKLVKLGDDIEITTMAGTYSNPFKGTFDGNGHKLTVTLENNGDTGTDESTYGVAPFRFTEGATIKNLTVDGTVTTTDRKFAAGFIGWAKGTTNTTSNIENCVSSVEINSTIKGDGTHGGFVGKASGTLNITNCLFNGMMTTSATNSTNSCGGFVGWAETANTGVIIKNSLYAPATIPEGKYQIGTNSSATFARNGANTGTDTNKSYYTETFGAAQGASTRGATGSALKNLLGDGWEVKNGNVVPVTKHVIVNPKFVGVTIDNTDRSITSGGVTFKGNYDARSFNSENKSILFLGAENTLYWPQSGASIGACRAYFEIPDGTLVRAFRLNFGDEEETMGIKDNKRETINDKHDADGWYNLNGVKVEKPTRKGLYIQNGRKVVIK